MQKASAGVIQGLAEQINEGKKILSLSKEDYAVYVKDRVDWAKRNDRELSITCCGLKVKELG